MSIASFNKLPEGFKVHRGRSLLVGIALLISGTILAQFVDQYISLQLSDSAITRSRLWWEVVLNLQIMSFGIVWFCYVDPITNSSGRWKRNQIIMFLVASVAVLMPSITGGVALANGWFSVRPDIDEFTYVFVLGVVAWLLALLFQYIMLYRFRSANTMAIRKRPFLLYFPILTLFGILAFDTQSENQLWYVATPFLLYVQGAVPYIIYAFVPKREEVQKQVSSQSGNA